MIAEISFEYNLENEEEIIEEIERVFRKFRRRKKLILSDVKFEGKQPEFVYRMKKLGIKWKN